MLNHEVARPERTDMYESNIYIKNYEVKQTGLPELMTAPGGTMEE